MKTGPILESKDKSTIFHKNDKEKCLKRAKKGKIFENLRKNVQNLKIIWKKPGDCVWLSHAINC